MSRVQIPFSFNYPSGGNLVPAVGASIAVYVRNSNGSTGALTSVFQGQTGSSVYQTLQTDSGGNVPGWVDEGSYHIIASSSGGFGGGVINFDALYGGGTAKIAAAAVDISHLTVNAQNSLVPTGAVLDFAGSIAPSGYFLCDGASYSTTTYLNLFRVIGYTHGGSGNTFKVPDDRGRTTIGVGTGSGLSSRTLGEKGGFETHILTPDQLALHSHAISDSGHSHSIFDPGHAHNLYDPGHVHGTFNDLMSSASAFVAPVWNNPQAGHTLGIYANDVNRSTAPTILLAATNLGIYSGPTNISIYGSTTGISVMSMGNNSPHNNMQPYLVVNKIIKY